MANNTVIVVHASAATVSLLLGLYNLRRRPRGDRVHRTVGWVWVGAMYMTIASSFAITRLDPGHFSWLHGVSVFTFGTLSIGVWAGITGRTRQHGGFMTGSYFGLVGAFIGAVVVPQRLIPQWIGHEPLALGAGAAACVAFSVVVVALARCSKADSASVRGAAAR